MNTVFITKPVKLMLTGMVLGGIITWLIVNFLAGSSHKKEISASSDVKKPLYWVAPMDANYRRDKPGKSPMGMDLLPVYDNKTLKDTESPGTIFISSEVVNNLGVRTAIADYQPWQSEINTVGYVTYDENKLVHIHPRVQGWIEKLYVKAVGDPVQKNQPLYEIYSPELVNAQEELLLALARNNQQLLEAAQNRLLSLKFSQVNITKLKKDKKVQQFVTFYAPQQGVVKQLEIREGFYVKPETLMLSIADLSEVWVKAEVFVRESGQVSMGDNVEMNLDYLPLKSWKGKIEHIHPMINAKTRTAIVRLRFDNPNGELKPNMFADITIHTKGDEHVLLIPKEALIRTGNQDRVVLALGEGRFKSIAVSVGRYGSDSVEILTGLKAGDQVVSSAQFLLDSESSKSSDFTRMNDDTTKNDIANNDSETLLTATVKGTVITVMDNHRMVTIKREAIEKWGRKADTVDFIVNDNVDMSLFSKNADVMFTFEVRDDDFIIISAMAHPKTVLSEFKDNTLNKGEH